MQWICNFEINNIFCNFVAITTVDLCYKTCTDNYIKAVDFEKNVFFTELHEQPA